METGAAFPQGPKDAILANVSKNKNPGPGAHNIKDPDASKPALNATMGHPEKAKPLFDNGVPGAGTYDIEDHKKIPSFKICQPSKLNEKQELLLKQKAAAIGPNHYNPTYPGKQKGTIIGNAERQEDAAASMNTPAPNRYVILGDFDFRDPNNLNDKSGKIPKFAFGIKTMVKSQN